MGVKQPFIGSYERIIGSTVFVKVYNKDVPGRVTGFSFKSGKYTVECADGKVRRVDVVYV